MNREKCPFCGGYNPSFITQDRGDGKIYFPLNKEEIARQSVTSGKVAEAIEWIEEILSNGNMWQDGDFGIPVKTSRKLEDIKQTILAALQAYRPKGE